MQNSITPKKRAYLASFTISALGGIFLVMFQPQLLALAPRLLVVALTLFLWLLACLSFACSVMLSNNMPRPRTRKHTSAHTKGQVDTPESTGSQNTRY